MRCKIDKGRSFNQIDGTKSTFFYVLCNHRVMYCKWHTIKDVMTAVNIMVDSGVGWIKSNKATNRKPLETLNCNAKPKRFQLTCHSPRSWSPVRCSWSCCGGQASAGFWCVWWNPSVCGSGSPGQEVRGKDWITLRDSLNTGADACENRRLAFSLIFVLSSHL